MMPEKKTTVFCDLLSPSTIELLTAKGSALIQQIGVDVVRGVIRDVLTGRNLRDSTEILTRKRIASLNLATVEMFINGSNLFDDFINDLPYLATTILSSTKAKKYDKWFSQWVLGLTDKAFQNILRDDKSILDDYRNKYIQICESVISNAARNFGELSGEMVLNSKLSAQINWLFITYLLNTIGAQTLSIRGSEKSTYGKLFEKLILGSLLYIIGFEYSCFPPQKTKKIFWLSSQGEKRESDATLLYVPGKGVRFDIGFIGRGNPEISLDKVTRFEREVLLGRSLSYISTIILVDRLGEKSKVEELARKVDGVVIQMSASYWPRLVVEELNRIFGYKHPMLKMSDSKIDKYINDGMEKVPILEFLKSK